jgi:hypothetical protein
LQTPFDCKPSSFTKHLQGTLSLRSNPASLFIYVLLVILLLTCLFQHCKFSTILNSFRLPSTLNPKSLPPGHLLLGVFSNHQQPSIICIRSLSGSCTVCHSILHSGKSFGTQKSAGLSTSSSLFLTPQPLYRCRPQIYQYLSSSSRNITCLFRYSTGHRLKCYFFHCICK